MRVEKVRGEVNVADHLTKGKAIWEFRGLLEEVGARMEGRGCDGGEKQGSRRWKSELCWSGRGGQGEVGGVMGECECRCWRWQRRRKSGGMEFGGRRCGWDCHEIDDG